MATMGTSDRVVQKMSPHKQKCSMDFQRIFTGHMLSVLLEDEILQPSVSSIGPWHLILLHERLVVQQLPGLRFLAGTTDPPFAAILVCEDEGLENSENLLGRDPDVILRDVLYRIGGLGLQATCIRLESEEARKLRLALEIPLHVAPTTMIVVRQAVECKESIDELCEISGDGALDISGKSDIHKDYY